MKYNPPEFKPFTVHLSFLRRHRACYMQHCLFKVRFGSKVTVTKELLPDLYADFDIDWFLGRVLQNDKEFQKVVHYYQNLHWNAVDRSHRDYQKALVAAALVNKRGYVPSNLSRRKLEQLTAIQGKRDEKDIKSRQRYWTRSLSYLGGRTFR